MIQQWKWFFHQSVLYMAPHTGPEWAWFLIRLPFAFYTYMRSTKGALK